MVLKHLMELYDILDDPRASGKKVLDYLRKISPEADAETYPLCGPGGSTDMVRVRIPGKSGKARGGTAPTIGLLGRLGGLGARPEVTGFVSDGDGALAALSAAAELLSMAAKGDVLEGDIFLSTHVCPDAPTSPHQPVPFMNSPVETAAVNREEVTDGLDAILCVDTTKGNRICNARGIAITPTVREGYILRVSEDLLTILEIATGELPRVLPLTTQDITPYGNGIYHVNSILQPSTATKAPVVGVAVTTQSAVPGCASGATHFEDVEKAVRFMIEAAKAFGAGKCSFCDEDEYRRLLTLYGSLSHLQTQGKRPE